MKTLSDLSVDELRGIIALKEQIQSLERQIEAIGGKAGADGSNPTEAPAPGKPVKRRLSAAHRRKLIKALAKARKARWTNAKAAAGNAAPKKHRMSATDYAA